MQARFEGDVVLTQAAAAHNAQHALPEGAVAAVWPRHRRLWCQKRHRAVVNDDVASIRSRPRLRADRAAGAFVRVGGCESMAHGSGGAMC